jgi:hypothetical protein
MLSLNQLKKGPTAPHPAPRVPSHSCRTGRGVADHVPPSLQGVTVGGVGPRAPTALPGQGLEAFL